MDVLLIHGLSSEMHEKSVEIDSQFLKLVSLSLAKFGLEYYSNIIKYALEYNMLFNHEIKEL